MKIEFESRDMAIMKKALETWGIDAQVDCAVEECAEMIVALHKHTKRAKRDDSRYNVLDEITDVFITLSQMRLAFDIGDAELHEHIKKKLSRVEERLSE